MAKEKVSADEKFENQEFDLFKALEALDKKDYGYLDRLTDEQQKKFVPYMMTHWMSAIKASGELGAYYVMSTECAANKHLFNEYVQKHPKLQWMMLCAASPGMGKQFHQWIPHMSGKVSALKEPAKAKDIKDYYSKIYKGASANDINALSEAFIDDNKKKCYLAQLYPNLKLSDIELLSQLITHADIEKHERKRGN